VHLLFVQLFSCLSKYFCVAIWTHSADVWIYPSSNWNELFSKKADYLSQFKSVKTMEVYDNQKSGESAWFEQRLAEYGECGLIFSYNKI
jgi:hypothetical protein